MILENTAPPTISGEEYLLQLEIARLNSKIHELKQCWEFSAQDGVRLNQSLEACNAEIEGLKAELNQVHLANEEFSEQARLLKAALRWCLDNAGIQGIDVYKTSILDCHGDIVEVPPEFAAVIAEAVKP